ncbi:7918_t:CDS:2, partial [Cetraspora pellucida]
TDRAITTHLLNLTNNQYTKWKNKTHTERQNNLNLNQQILSDNISDFLVKLRLYLQNQDVNPADNAGGPPTRRE